MREMLRRFSANILPLLAKKFLRVVPCKVDAFGAIGSLNCDRFSPERISAGEPFRP